MPQMSDAASVVTAVRTRYVLMTARDGSGMAAWSLRRGGGGPAVALRQRADMVDQLGWLRDREVVAERAEVDGHHLEAVGAGVQDARSVVDRRYRADPRTDLLVQGRRRDVDQDPRLEPPR